MAVKLNLAQQAEIEKALRQLHDLDRDIAKATDCGLECQAHKVQAERLRGQLEAMRAAFGSGVGMGK